VTTCNLPCRFRLTASSGVITDGTGNYTKDNKCTWLIDSSRAAVSPVLPVRLKFDEFITECSWDHLYIFDGSSVYDPLIAVFRSNFYHCFLFSCVWCVILSPSNWLALWGQLLRDCKFFCQSFFMYYISIDLNSCFCISFYTVYFYFVIRQNCRKVISSLSSFSWIVSTSFCTHNGLLSAFNSKHSTICMLQKHKFILSILRESRDAVRAAAGTRVPDGYPGNKLPG